MAHDKSREGRAGVAGLPHSLTPMKHGGEHTHNYTAGRQGKQGSTEERIPNLGADAEENLGSTGRSVQAHEK